MTSRYIRNNRKLDFETKKLADNAAALVSDLNKAKPSSAKGKYMKNITISSTMGLELG